MSRRSRRRGAAPAGRVAPVDASLADAAGTPAEFAPARRPMGRNLWAFMATMSGWHQVALGLLAILTAALSLAPIELQRRIIDDAIARGDAELLLLLGGVYAGVIVLNQAAKYGLGYYQSWVGERTSAHARGLLLDAFLKRNGGGAAEGAGEAVAILNAEVDKLGGFIGTSPSSAMANAALVTGVLLYMALVEPAIALASLAMLAPQLAVTPLVQRRLSALVRQRLLFLRRFGDAVTGEAPAGDRGGRWILRILANRLRFMNLKFLLKALVNALNAGAVLAILLYGGWLVVEGRTSLGVVIAFLSGFERIANPMRDLIAFYRETAQAEVQHGLIASWLQKPRS